MPGPKKAASGGTATADAPLVRRMGSAGGGAAALPSTEGFVSSKVVRLRGPDGYYEETEQYWTKRGLMRWLAQCPRVVVNVARDPTTDPDDLEKPSVLTVFYDGFEIAVPKGEPVEVPAPIAEIIANTQTKYRTAQAQGLRLFEIDATNPNGLEIDAGGLGFEGAFDGADDE